MALSLVRKLPIGHRCDGRVSTKKENTLSHIKKIVGDQEVIRIDMFEVKDKGCLSESYIELLEYAQNLNIKTLALPLLKPLENTSYYDTLHSAISSIKRFLEFYDMHIYLIVKDEGQSDEEHHHIIKDYLNQHRTQGEPFRMISPYAKGRDHHRIDRWFKRKEENFQETLLTLIDEKNIPDSMIYKKANIDRRLFSKIRSQKDYQPSKNTALALGIALELDLERFIDFLSKAGYALSLSQDTDLIVRYYIEQGNYDIFEINMTLFEFTEKTL